MFLHLHIHIHVRLFQVCSHGSYSHSLKLANGLSSTFDRVSWKACRTRQVTVSLVPPALLQMQGKDAARIISSGDAFIPNWFLLG